MDFDFGEPTLRIHCLIHGARMGSTKAKEELKNMMMEMHMYGLYKHLISKELMEYNQEDLEKMQETKEARIRELEKLREKDPENENYLSSIDKQVSEVYAQSLDLRKACETMKALTREDTSLSLKMDIFLCKIRMAIILRNRRLLEENIAFADETCDLGCDWDRRNKYKIYRAVYNLMRAEFSEAALLISEALPSFESSEVISCERAVVYLILSGLLTFGREEIRKRILESSEVIDGGCVTGMELASSLYNCRYGSYMRGLHAFCSEVEGDVFIGGFVGHFCKEMKIRVYGQMLESYRSLSLPSMATTFGIEAEFLERDLSRFIVEGRLRCKIDRVSGVVETDGNIGNGAERVVCKSSMLLRKIRKCIK
jgi:26S proteasome regulatory subunit N7